MARTKRPPTIGWRALRYVAPSLTAQEARVVAGGLGVAMKRFGITSPLQAAMFVAQCAHESAGYRTSTEYASGEEYEGRHDLGNIHPGDGVRFKGRGRIQITGRVNYQHVSDALHEDFIGHPERLALSPWSEIASAWWWKSHGLSEICDSHRNTEDRLRACTYRINGGYRGLDERRAYLQRAMRVKRLLVPR